MEMLLSDSCFPWLYHHVTDQYTVEYYSLDSRTGLVEKQTSRKPTTSLNTLNLSGIEKGKVYFFTVKSTPLHSDKPAAYSDYVEFKRTS